jgi:hypothetical protein
MEALETLDTSEILDTLDIWDIIEKLETLQRLYKDDFSGGSFSCLSSTVFLRRIHRCYL